MFCAGAQFEDSNSKYKLVVCLHHYSVICYLDNATGMSNVLPR